MKNRIIPSVCICLVLAGLLFADSTFTGAVSDLWSNPDNWSDGLPDAEDKAQFRDGTLCILDYDAGVLSHVALQGEGTDHLRLVDGAVLTVARPNPLIDDSWIIIGYDGSPDESHLLEVLGGEINSSQRIRIGHRGKGKLVIDYSGVVNITDQHFSLGHEATGDGRVELRGGTLNLNDVELLFNEGGATSSASMDFSGGVLTWDLTDAGLALINDLEADGTITAYDGVGTVVREVEDNVLAVKGLHPFKPVPEDSGIALPGSTILEWTIDVGIPVDVWLGTKADLSDFKKIVDKQVVTSKVVNTVAKQRYFWAVDFDKNADGAITEDEYGPVFDFLADNITPEVEAAADITTWLDNGSVDVAISATVTDVDPTTVSWTITAYDANEPSDPNVLLPVDGPILAVIADDTQLETTVTISAVGTYVLQLTADDGEYQGEGTMIISVSSNSCLATQSLPGYVQLVGDINLDCVVDQADLDILLEQWLNCNGLDCPGIDPVDPIVDPNGL